jgi:hypothetical protein
VRNHYPLGRRYALLRAETFYRTNDGGLCCGAPLRAAQGLVVHVIPLADGALPWQSGGTIKDAAVLCEVELDGAPAYGWIALSWLDPINPQRELFSVEQPTLFA